MKYILRNYRDPYEISNLDKRQNVSNEEESEILLSSEGK